MPLTDATRALLTEKTVDGVNLFFAPGGYSLILHVMQFPWNENGAPRSGIGATDADLIKNWPGLQFDNTRDYIMLGINGATRNLPVDILQRDGEGLCALFRELTRTWDARCAHSSAWWTPRPASRSGYAPPYRSSSGPPATSPSSATPSTP